MAKDLEFLYGADNSDLRIVVDYLTKDKSGDSRWTESLTETEEYRGCYPHDLCNMSESIAGELCRYGGNTFMNLIRGGGVEYKEVLTDVCKKLKVNFNKQSSVEVIEMNLLQKIFLSSLEEMSSFELEALMKEMDLPVQNYSKQAMMAVIQMAIRRGGFAGYKIAVIVANAIAKALLGRGLSIAANASLTRWMSIFAGPIGWAVTVLWTAIDIAGPAYRVTIPTVIQIAYMRTKIQYLQQ